MSPYQSIKLLLLDIVPLSRDGFHIYIGFGCFMATLWLRRKPLTSFLLVTPGLVLAVMLEVLDLHDDVVGLGHARWGASLFDVINTNVIPICIVALARAGVIARASRLGAGDDTPRE